MPAAPEIRPARADDIPAAARCLGLAFAPDPLMSWAVPGDDVAARLTRLFTADVRTAVLQDAAWVATIDGDVVGVASWRRPATDPGPAPGGLGGLRVRAQQALSSAQGLRRAISVFGRRTPQATRFFHQLTEHRLRHAPHWYLSAIGTTVPGAGVGGGLLRAGLAAADREHSAAFLESSALRNVAIYQRYGFEVVDELTAPGNGPVIPLMLRPAQTL